MLKPEKEAKCSIHQFQVDQRELCVCVWLMLSGMRPWPFVSRRPLRPFSSRLIFMFLIIRTSAAEEMGVVAHRAPALQRKWEQGFMQRVAGDGRETEARANTARHVRTLRITEGLVCSWSRSQMLPDVPRRFMLRWVRLAISSQS